MTADKPDRDDGEGFLSRWSRRKQQVGRAAAAEPVQPVPAPAAGREPVPPGTGPRAPIPASAPADSEPDIDLSKLPSLDELTADTDFTQFLARGVPEELRTAALRRAWTLDPKIRDFVEVAENQWDFNAPDGVPGFGALAPGTDLDSLLAQATGRSPAPEPPPAAVASSGPPPASPSGSDVALQYEREADRQPDDVASSEPVSQGDQLAQPPAASTISAGTAARPDALAEHKQPPPRRRHGGALPG